MVYDWTSQFEGLPTNSDFGSGMGKSTRDVKAAFKERMQAQHTFSDSDTVVEHKRGESTIVKVLDADESVTGDQVEHAILAQEKSLYRDNGISTEAVSGVSHLDLEGTGDDDHTQYFKTTGGDDIESDYDVPAIVNHKTAEGAADTEVLPKAHETQTSSTSGGARHKAGVIGSSSLSLGLDKASMVNGTFTITTTMTATDLKEVTQEDYSSFPFLLQVKTSDGSENTGAEVQMYAYDTTFVNDYKGRYQLGSGLVASQTLYPDIIIGYKYFAD